MEEAITQASKGRRVRGRPGQGWESLTKTELRVAELLVQGLTNPEIAERLVVAPSTVKTHVSHIFDALVVSNRTEAVYALARAGVGINDLQVQDRPSA